MIDLTITPRGFDAMLARIRRGINLDDAIGRGLGEWAKETLDDELYGQNQYPSPPPNSRYIRTGNLGRNWGLARQGKTGVKFQNTAAYARYVVGAGSGQGQARRMAHWWLGRRKIEARLPQAKTMIGREIRKDLWR